jgi:hypothetical protein
MPTSDRHRRDQLVCGGMMKRSIPHGTSKYELTHGTEMALTTISTESGGKKLVGVHNARRLPNRGLGGTCLYAIFGHGRNKTIKERQPWALNSLGD